MIDDDLLLTASRCASQMNVVRIEAQMICNKLADKYAGQKCEIPYGGNDFVAGVISDFLFQFRNDELEFLADITFVNSRQIARVPLRNIKII